MLSRYVPDSWMLFAFQIVAHIALVWQVFNGTLQDWMITFAVYFMTGCLGMTMTYHRLLSHQSWKAPRWFEVLGTLAGTYGLTGSSIGWVAVHREHHRYTDRDGDPHSPHTHGFIRVQWLSMFEKPKAKFALHLIRDRLHATLHKYYFAIHAAILVVLMVASPTLCVAMYLAPAALLWNAGSLINTATHMFGYRNYETRDNSTNVWFLGYLMWGEGWHNNHHNRPSDSRFGERWWEVDIGYLLIRLLGKRP